MGLFEQFPYSNFHELNLDWILQKIKELEEKVDSIEDRILKQANAYTDASIAMLLLQLPDIITKNIKNAKVYNLLTGKYVTIQAMFNFLCLFHAPGALTCGDMYAKNNTCTQIINYNKTCQEFITDAKNFVVQH